MDELEPLPNIDFNILPGNSLIGLMRVDEKEFDRRNPPNMFQKSYHQLVDEKRRQLETYRHMTQFTEELQFLRDEIEKGRQQAYASLNDLLLNEFSRLEIKYEQATWDEKKGQEGKPKKRAVQLPDVEALQPFHWGYEFDEVMNTRGGFDAIITNPPWETFQPDGKEFFSKYSPIITKKSMTVADFNAEVSKLLVNPQIRQEWQDYQGGFSYQRGFFRFSHQYENQVPIIDGKRHGKDVNLFKLFVEQTYNLLRPGGLCGIVIPSGIYTDLGAMKLRELLFNHTQITSLFCFENRKEIFEGVHRSFKFLVLTFEKGGKTMEFHAAFMRHDVSELADFSQNGGVTLDVDLIRKLSPDSLSVMEFKNVRDVNTARKMSHHPILGEQVDDKWQLELHREFNMTDDAYLFQTSYQPGSQPLFEGKMIWQFTHTLSEPRYWIDTEKGRKALLGKMSDHGQVLGYQKYRLAHRSVASNTNERSLICTIIPPCFTGNSLNVSESLQV